MTDRETSNRVRYRFWLVIVHLPTNRERFIGVQVADDRFISIYNAVKAAYGDDWAIGQLIQMVIDD